MFCFFYLYVLALYSVPTKRNFTIQNWSDIFTHKRQTRNFVWDFKQAIDSVPYSHEFQA